MADSCVGVCIEVYCWQSRVPSLSSSMYQSKWHLKLQHFSGDLTFHSMQQNPLKQTWKGAACADDGALAWPGITCFYNRVALVTLHDKTLRGGAVWQWHLVRAMSSGHMPISSVLVTAFMNRCNKRKASSCPMLAGTLPASFANLSFAYALFLSDNSLSGAICMPYHLCQDCVHEPARNSAFFWTALENLCCCPGTLPPEWSCMKETRIINLRNNYVTGACLWALKSYNINVSKGARSCKPERIQPIMLLQGRSPRDGPTCPDCGISH